MKTIKLKLIVFSLAIAGMLIPNSAIRNSFSLNDAYADAVDDMLQEIIDSGYDEPINEYDSFDDLTEEDKRFFLNNRDIDGPEYSDNDGGSFWDRVWDNTFNRDWEEGTNDCFDSNGFPDGYEVVCNNGNNDMCNAVACKIYP